MRRLDSVWSVRPRIWLFRIRAGGLMGPNVQSSHAKLDGMLGCMSSRLRARCQRSIEKHPRQARACQCGYFVRRVFVRRVLFRRGFVRQFCYRLCLFTVFFHSFFVRRDVFAGGVSARFFRQFCSRGSLSSYLFRRACNFQNGGPQNDQFAPTIEKLIFRR